MQHCQIWDQGSEAQALLRNKWQGYSFHIATFTVLAAKKMTKITGSHGGKSEDDSCLGYGTV
jgi:hypothetical protein